MLARTAPRRAPYAAPTVTHATAEHARHEEPPASPLRRAGRAPVALLVHGFTGTPWELRPIADVLSSEGFAVQAELLPGHGTRVEDMSYRTFAEWDRAVDRLVRDALAEHGSAVLVGMSLGGLLAIASAARHQTSDPSVHSQGVRALVTLGCALELTPVVTRALRLFRALGPMMPPVLLAKKTGSDVRDDEARAQNPGYRSNPLRAAREFDRAQAAAREALPSVRVPFLAVHGADDRTAPSSASHRALALSGSSDAALVLAPRSGHLVGVDRDRALVTAAVRAFVGRTAL